MSWLRLMFSGECSRWICIGLMVARTMLTRFTFWFFWQGVVWWTPNLKP